MAVYKNENGQVVKYAGSSSNIIDSALSKESSNAVQNRVVAEKFESLEEKVNANETTILSHKNDQNNPHCVTKSQINLGNVEDKSSETIRSEITKENVTTALGYTPYTPNEVDNKFSTLETNIDWKEAVDTFADIATTYPNPKDGWTVNVKDTDYTYRYNGSEWVAISANAIPKATNSVDGLLTKEDHVKYNDAVSKAHTHDNKSVLDGITSDKVSAWDTVNDKVDKEDSKGLSTNDYTTTEKNKLAGIATGAEVNQNAFSNVVVGSTTIAADSKTDTLTLVAGSNVTITPDATNDKITITATDTNTWRGIQNSLTSTSTSDSLAANQGKVLKGLIDEVKSLRATLDAYGLTKVTNSSAVTDSTGLALSATEKNATIEGTLANQISQLNTDLPQMFSNPNLLINPDFKINQRGETTYSDDSVYTIDRWKKHTNGYTKVVGNGVEISTDLYQYLEYPERYFGKTVTLTAKVDGVVKSGTGTIPNNFAETVITVIYLDFDNAGLGLYVENRPSNKIQGCNINVKSHEVPVIVEWAKLELGSVSTPFVPPDPASELLKCQRYYEVRKRAFGHFYASSNYRSNMQFSTKMRTVPTLLVNIDIIDVIGRGNICTPSGVTVPMITDESVGFDVITNEQIDVTIGALVVTFGTIILDAEIR